MNAKSTQEGTPAPSTTVHNFTFSLYSEVHTFPVDKNLSKNIRKCIIDANRGNSPKKEGLSYQAPSEKTIREVIMERFVTVVEHENEEPSYITHFKKERKIDFHVKGALNKVTAFIFNAELCRG